MFDDQYLLSCRWCKQEMTVRRRPLHIAACKEIPNRLKDRLIVAGINQLGLTRWTLTRVGLDYEKTIPAQ